MADIKDIIYSQKSFFHAEKTRSLAFRKEQLELLKNLVIKHEKEILDALHKDLGKAAFEAYETEIGVFLTEINYILKNLPSWLKIKRVRTPFIHFLSKSYRIYEPYGRVLIISPWNYPFHLSLMPLIGSMAAGNCSLIKPSEFSPHSSDLLDKIIKNNFSQEYIRVIQGDEKITQSLLQEKFDYIFFTGSSKVGKEVMRAAATHLSPISLELGGKSPCIVDKSANIKLSAKKICWAKFLNAGQTCVAPDFLVVHKDIKEGLIREIKRYIKEFYGENPLDSPDYAKIINKAHFLRLLGLMQEEEITYGGQYQEKELKISPTLIDKVNWDSSIMQEEIFGPLLPILEYEDIRELINIIKERPKALALYIFSENKEKIKKLVHSLSSGGVCVNECIVHMASPYLPFGGVGESGMGAYHGKSSFKTFSHSKSVLEKSNLLDIPLRYPPFNKLKLDILRKLMR